MNNRILRLLLVVLAVAGQAGSGFFVVQSEQQHAADRGALLALTRETARLQSLVGALRGAQAALVAQGQDAGYWVPKVAGLVQDVGSGLARIDKGALGTEAGQDLTAATEAIAAFSKTSDRVRDLLATEQPLTASSVVFGDAAQHLSTALAALGGLVPDQAMAVDREEMRLRQSEAYALIAAAGLTLIALLVLLPRPRQPLQDTDDSQAPAAGLGLSLGGPAPGRPEPLAQSRFDLDIPHPAESPGPSGLPEQPHESEVAIMEALQRESQLRLGTEAQVDLTETARLCGDLARVKNSADLPALLDRAAGLLNASGIVVWIADQGGDALRPAVSHGYTEQTLAKMGALSGRAENAVSVAWRSGQMEVVRGAKDRNGAVVVPITTAAGCVGAMTAEIRHGGESSPSIQAVAAILAAQVATLVAEEA
jgi:hypothetical protein